MLSQETERRLGDLILAMLRDKPARAAIGPADVARRAGDEDWKRWMERVREVARRMHARGEIEVTRHGRPVEGWPWRGVVRFRMPREPARVVDATDGDLAWSAAPTFGERSRDLTAVIRPSVYALLADERGRIALVRTPQCTSLPGGGVEAGESVEKALVREVREECGCEVRVGAWTRRAVQHVDSVPERTHFVKRCTFYEAELLRRGVGPAEADHELFWAAPDEAVRLFAHAAQAWAVGEWKAGR